MNIEQLALRLAAVEARLAVLEAGGGSTSSGNGGKDVVRKEEAIDDHHLDNQWADKPIKKDPTRWKGKPQIGKTWSQAPIEWLEAAAASKEYAAHMGRLLPDEDPKKWSNQLDKKGTRKAWHEGNTFDAKILRGWIARRKRLPLPPQASPADDDFGFGANQDDGFGGM